MHGGIVPAPARFNWYHGSACYSIVFDASMNSFNTISWDFAGGTGTDCTASSATPTCTYTGTTSKSVTLTLDAGTLTERSRTMIVTPRGSNARPDAGVTVAVDTTDTSGMSVVVTDSSSVNTVACGASLVGGTATILWGDGTVDIVNMPAGTAPAHTYTKNGTYTVRYSVKDTNNNSAMASPVTVTVPANSSGVGLFTVSGSIHYGASTRCFSTNDDNNDGKIDVNDGDDCTDDLEIGPNQGVFNATITVKTTGGTIVKYGKTDEAGDYAIPGIQGGQDYIVVPSKNGMTFAPESGDSATVNIGDQTADFTATLD